MDSRGEIVPFRETEIYKDDLIGIQKLDKAHKIYFQHIKARHLKFSYGDVRKTMLPSLYHKDKYVFTRHDKWY